MYCISVYFYWKYDVARTNRKTSTVFGEEKKTFFKNFNVQRRKITLCSGRCTNIKTNVQPRYMLCHHSACSRRPRGHVRQGRTNERPRATTLTARAATDPRTLYGTAFVCFVRVPRPRTLVLIFFFYLSKNSSIDNSPFFSSGPRTYSPTHPPPSVQHKYTYIHICSGV